MAPTAEDTGLRSALKQSASALKADGVPFALGGGYALWASGAPEPIHDVDMVVPEGDVQAAVDSLSAAGFQIERPPRIGCSRHTWMRIWWTCCIAWPGCRSSAS